MTKVDPRTRPVILFAIVLLNLLGTGPALAGTDEEIYRDLRFNFINPGGRSLGMSGASIAIANDATAAQANPACLTNVETGEFFSEVRWLGPDDTRTERPFRDPINTSEGFDVSVTTDADATVSPTFLSYVRPWKRIWLGVSRQEVINTQHSTASTYDFLFATGDDTRTGEGEIDMRLTNWNVSTGFALHDRFSAGLTVSFGTMNLDSTLVNTYTDPTGAIIGDPSLAGTAIEMYRTVADDSDSDITVTAGVLFSILDSLSLGAVYRQGGDFSIDTTLIGQPIDPSLVPGQIAERVFFNESDTLLTAVNNTHPFPNEFHIPDVIGVGIAWRPVERLTLALDGVQITYSDLMEDFNSRLNVLTAGFQEEDEAAFTVDDQTNIHFGAEYLIERESMNWFLRAGFHTDKDNRIRSNFEPGGFGLGDNLNFPGRDDVDHYSFGVGLTFAERFILDLAGNTSDLGTEVVTSFIYRFPK